jgi:lysophospholipase L1-like esterase
MGGTNDIAGNMGPVTVKAILRNLRAMVELGTAHGIRVILAAVTPVNGNHPRDIDYFLTHPPETIVALNRGIKSLASTYRLKYLDTWSLLADKDGFLDARYSHDGLHLKDSAYRVLDRLMFGR